ncbi:40S ribosomal protein S15, partial [Termitomyces sp. J132]
SSITDPTVAAELKKKRTFRTFSYRGVELDKLLDMSNEEFVELVHARARRRFQRGLKRRPMGLIKKLRKAKKEAPPNEKPAVVKTHLRDMIVVPEMIGSVVGIYNGKVFNSVEIKPEMTGHYLGEFSCSYRPVKHGRPGVRVFPYCIENRLISLYPSDWCNALCVSFAYVHALHSLATIFDLQRLVCK